MADHKYNIACTWTMTPGGEAGRVNVGLAARVQESDTGKDVVSIDLNYTNLPPQGPASLQPPLNSLEMFGKLWEHVVGKMTKEGYPPTQVPSFNGPPPQSALTTWDNVDLSGVILAEKLIAQEITWLSNFGEKMAQAQGKKYVKKDSKLNIPF